MRVLQRVRSRVSSFNFQYSLLSLRLSNSCLRLFALLTVPSFLASVFPSITCFRKLFLRKMWPVQLVFLFSIVCMISRCYLILCNTFSFLARSIEMIVSSSFSVSIWNFPGISNLLYEVSKFQHRSMLSFKGSISLVSPLNLLVRPICW